MQYADIVVPRGGQNRVAVQLIVEHVKDQLKQVTSPGLVPWLMAGWHIAALYSLLPVCVQRGFNNRSKLLDGQGGAQALPSSVHLLPSKPQVKAMHTVIRSAPPSSSEPLLHVSLGVWSAGTRTPRGTSLSSLPTAWPAWPWSAPSPCSPSRSAAHMTPCDVISKSCDCHVISRM